MKNSLALATLLLFALNGLAQIPVLNSLPGSQYVVYLDFDGEVVNNTNWSATTINATSSGLTSAQIIEVFRRVSEKYRPFDVNITTSLSVYNAAAINKRIQVVVTTTSSWYGSAGGVAFVGSFGWPAYSPAFVFPNQLTYNADYVATAAAHEIGHTLALNHHAPYDASCNRIGYYHPGQGTGQTSWGPIMGAPYYSNFVVWYKGPTTSPTCAQTNQDDLALITGYIPYRNDDHGNTASVATTMNIVSNAISDSGSIERNNDVDFFKFTLSQTSNLTLNVRPWSLDPQNNTAACLDARVELLNSAGALLIADESPSTLNASISVSNLAAGTYFVKVDGVGISNYNDYGGTGPNDYGSLGRFYLTGTITSLATGIKPSANFNISPTACQGSAITATNTSTNNPTSFLWTCNGSNPSTSILQNAIFTFNSPGTYSVKLKATNSFGSDSITKSITINANPSITGSANTTICSGTTTTLTAGGATTYVWSPTTGLNISTGTTVNAAPTASTTYTVVGTGSGGCTGSRTVAVTVNSAPTLTTSANASICSGTSTTMSASGATSYTWTPNTSINTSTGSSVTATPTSSTTYTVTGSGTNGCTSSKTITVTVNANPVLTGSANTTTCSGTTTTLTSGGATTYAWSPTTGLNISTGTTVNAAPTASTTYTVVGTGSGGCTGSRTVSVTVNSAPTLTTSANASICSGTSTTMTVAGGNTYVWSPNTAINSSTGGAVTANPTSTITYTVTGTGANGCTSNKTISVTVNSNPVLTGSANTTICSGTTTTLTSGGATTYAWSPTTGLNISTGTTVNAAPTASTTYTVVGTGSGGCTGSRTVSVTVNSAPTLTTSANASICSGTSTTMSASGATSYTWTPNTLINTSTGSSVTAIPTSSITYTVTGSGTNGCTSSKTITVTVNANPVLTGSANTTTCSGTTTTLTSGGATTYVWSPTTGLNISTGTTVNAAPTASTTYTVVGTGSGGCTGSRTVSVKLTSTCGVPTGITVQNITGTSAQITWSAQPCAITYRLQYRASGLISWTNISSISGATISITGLQSNTTYQYRLRSNCSTSTNSNYSAIQTFSTTSSLKTSNELNDEYETANIYPNPTSGILNINVSYDEAGMLQLELYNIYGQRVWQQFQWVESEGVFNFNISHLAPGVYMLMMRKEQETSSYKLIKQ